MPPYSWPVDPNAASNALGPIPSRYLAWATWAVDGLYYLDDATEEPERRRWNDLGHNVFKVDLMNARAAAAGAVTALDLCAAALGELHAVPRPSNWGPERVHDVRSLRERKKLLNCAGCADWITSVNDDSYRLLVDARDPLVHRIAPQHAYVTLGGPNLGHAALTIGSTNPREMPTKEIVTLARDTATAHVVSLLRAIEAGKIV